MYHRDTIAAVSTAPGNGGIGIVRVSGDLAAAIGEAVFKPIHDGGLSSHRFYFGFILDRETGEVIDEAMAVLMLSPKSYTREDVLELHCHGSWLVMEKVLSQVLLFGARLAEPGEFTQRAFLNGRIDLIQAESVMDIISSKSHAALQLAQKQREGHLSIRIEKIRNQILTALALVEAYVDFPEDDIGNTDMGAIRTHVYQSLADIRLLLDSYDEGQIMREGVSVLIIGRPNVGKSSLLNLLLQEDRAIVTHIPGTTRDIIEEAVNINGLAVRLLDSAGIRHTDDIVELAGINRSLEKINLADLVLFVLDSSDLFSQDDLTILDALSGQNFIAVFNKSDLPSKLELPANICFEQQSQISAQTGEGVENLKRLVFNHFMHGTSVDQRDFIAISKVRHRDALVVAELALSRFKALNSSCDLELLAIDLRCAMEAVGSIVGHTTPDEVLNTIFSSFCIGK